MRHRHLTLVALGTLALAACGNQAPDAGTGQAVTAEDVAAKRAELERLEAELAQQQQPPAAATESPPPAAAAPAQRQPAANTSRPASSTAANRPASTRPATSTSQPPARQSITVPAGTEIPVELVTALSTKSAKVGQAVHARVTTNVMVDGRTAIPQGLNVAGTVVEVVSGSDRIGGTPGLLLAFERIELPNGDDVPISGEFEEKGKSDNTRDAVKIVGGAAAGTLLADQVSSKRDRNRVIGGIIGAAAGAVAAKETGTEVKLDAGTTFTLILSAPVEMPRT